MSEFEDERSWTLLRSQQECPKCHDILASIHVHDFQTCSCGETSLDGGLDYTRIAGNWIITADIEKFEALNHSLFISGEHTKASKAAALEIYKALWEASAEGQASVSGAAVYRQVVERRIRLGRDFKLTDRAVIAYLKSFEDTKAVKRSSTGWKPLVPLVQRADAP